MAMVPFQLRITTGVASIVASDRMTFKEDTLYTYGVSLMFPVRIFFDIWRTLLLNQYVGQWP